MRTLSLMMFLIVAFLLFKIYTTVHGNDQLVTNEQQQAHPTAPPAQHVPITHNDIRHYELDDKEVSATEFVYNNHTIHEITLPTGFTCHYVDSDMNKSLSCVKN